MYSMPCLHAFDHYSWMACITLLLSNWLVLWPGCQPTTSLLNSIMLSVSEEFKESRDIHHATISESQMNWVTVRGISRLQPEL